LIRDGLSWFNLVKASLHISISFIVSLFCLLSFPLRYGFILSLFFVFLLLTLSFTFSSIFDLIHEFNLLFILYVVILYFIFYLSKFFWSVIWFFSNWIQLLKSLSGLFGTLIKQFLQHVRFDFVQQFLLSAITQVTTIVITKYFITHRSIHLGRCTLRNVLFIYLVQINTQKFAYHSILPYSLNSQTFRFIFLQTSFNDPRM